MLLRFPFGAIVVSPCIFELSICEQPSSALADVNEPASSIGLAGSRRFPVKSRVSRDQPRIEACRPRNLGHESPFFQYKTTIKCITGR